jgi:hypothetical protein
VEHQIVEKIILRPKTSILKSIKTRREPA